MQHLAIGIDIGGTRTKIGLVDLAVGRVLDRRIQPTEKRDAQRFEASLGEAIDGLKANAAAQEADVVGIGIGVSSFVFADGTVDSTYGFQEFMEDYPLAQRITQAHGLPCRVDNDARLVALGEALYGAGRGFGRVLVLTLGTGLGVGLVVDQQLDGALPYGHMAGNITVATDDVGWYSGKTGCLEALVSATGLVQRAERRGWATKHPNVPLSAEAIFGASETGHADALDLVRELVGHLKTGLDNYVNLFAPDRIVLGGGVAKGLKPYLAHLETYTHLGPYKRYRFSLALSSLDEEAGILGSAALFRP